METDVKHQFYNKMSSYCSACKILSLLQPKDVIGHSSKLRQHRDALCTTCRFRHKNAHLESSVSTTKLDSSTSTSLALLSLDLMERVLSERQLTDSLDRISPSLERLRKLRDDAISGVGKSHMEDERLVQHSLVLLCQQFVTLSNRCKELESDNLHLHGRVSVQGNQIDELRRLLNMNATVDQSRPKKNRSASHPQFTR